MAKEYIEREALVKDMRDYADRKAACGHIELANGILKGVGRAEDFPAADVVEVVRCRDCKWWNDCDDESYCSNPDGLDNYALPDDFCSYGERRENDA